jgi:ABC-type dipeptide/oligopeptide/nickel transport system ATPase subunit
METIKVSVSGPSGSGKSGVIQLMMEALHAKGLNVQFINPEHPIRDAERLQTVIDNIKSNMIVFDEVYTRSATPPTLRRVQRSVDAKWQDVLMQDLKSGDRFRMFEPDGTPVTSFDKENASEWVVHGAPFLSNGVWGVAVSAEARTSSEADTDQWAESQH